MAFLEAGDEWVHPETGDRIPDEPGSLAGVENADEYGFEWTCPDCGRRFVKPDLDSDEFAPAGWTTVHVPCATEEELRAAIDEEQLIIDILDQAERI